MLMLHYWQGLCRTPLLPGAEPDGIQLNGCSTTDPGSAASVAASQGVRVNNIL